MKRMALRKIFLPVVIFLFSVLVLGEPGWACDEPAPECSVQLDIKWVDVDLYNSLIYIWGKNFDNGPIKPPDVTLAGYPLVVKPGLSNAEWIVAELPEVEKVIAYGQYRLRVSTGNGHKCKDKYSVKIHPAPPKPPCEPSPGTCTCPEVTFVTEIVNSDKFPFDDVTRNFKGTASCAAGYRVTGGGFSIAPDAPGTITVNESKPYEVQGPNGTETGWELYVSATVTDANLRGVTVWAVCGKVQKVQ